MTRSLFDKCVNPMKEGAIPHIMNDGKLAGYKDAGIAKRYFSPELLYSAVWLVNATENIEGNNSPIHTHPFPETNILAAAPGDLVYRILIGDEEHEIESPAVIVIPPNVPHAANIVRGCGAFVVHRLENEKLEAVNDLSFQGQ